MMLHHLPLLMIHGAVHLEQILDHGTTFITFLGHTYIIDGANQEQQRMHCCIDLDYTTTHLEVYYIS